MKIPALPFSDEDYMHHALNHLVLIADDEAIKRQAAGGIAMANGFRYRITTSASEAWLELNAHPKAYDMLITDISMPEGDGESLANPWLAAGRDLLSSRC
jgi:DNA-binding NtrC family response regulator